MKNILFIKGQSQYDAMRNYIDEMAEECLRLGYNVLVLDGMDMRFSALFAKYTESMNFDLLITCNGQYIEEEFFRKKFPARCIYMCDHPSAHMGRLAYADERTIVCVLDGNHKAYIEKYIKNIKHTLFLPLGGSFAENEIPYSVRSRDVVFTGTYVEPEAEREHILAQYEGVLKVFAEHMLNMIIQTSELTLEEVLQKTLENFGQEVTDEDFQELMVNFIGVDRYARFYYRDKVIRALVENGIRVNVFGNGWEKFVCKNPENLIIESGDSYLAMKAVASAKISLNLMPWFKDGFQERIVTAMLSRTAAVTDSSKYIDKNLTDGENVILFSLRNMDELVEKVKDILSDTEKAERIAEQGYVWARENSTWAKRTDVMMDFVKKSLGWEDEDNQMPGTKIIPILGAEEKRCNVGSLIQRLQDLEKRIADIVEFSSFEKCDLYHVRKRMYDLILEIKKTLPEIATGRYIFDLLYDDTDNVYEYTAEMFLLECRNILGQLRNIEKNYLQEDNERLSRTAEYMRRQLNTLQRKEMDILCARLIRKYEQDSSEEIQKVIQQIKETNYVDAYNYKFADKYVQEDFMRMEDVLWDSAAQMWYVELKDKKRVYYPKKYNQRDVFFSFRFICIEQDEESPHKYLDDDFQVEEGDIVVDAGVAEGNFSLEIIDKVSKLYLIECEHDWVEALQKTFEPYKEKVVIIEKMLGAVDDDTHITIDGLLADKTANFIKMDIEGAEEDALRGAENTLRNSDKIKCAICAYHRHRAEEMIKNRLSSAGFHVSTTQGYMWFKEDMENQIDVELRRGIVRGIK